MTDKRKWIIPSKFNGRRLKQTTWRWDASLVKALLSLAAEETAAQGRKIAAPALAMNLMIGNGPYWNQKRAALKRHYQALHKENQRVRGGEQAPEVE